MTNQKPNKLIKLDKYTNQIMRPTLILRNKSLDAIGKIGHFQDWNFTLNGNSIDEISFTVNKYTNGVLCPVWDDLIDLKTVEVKGYGNFEISVSYTNDTQTVKSITGQSLEVELGQLILHNFYVNDENAMDMIITGASSSDYDSEGNFIPTVLYNENDTKHSLLHRVLADKAPHWSIGHVCKYVTKDEDSEAELVSKFQRTYTVDGTSIYDFLTGNVSSESNVVFLFDTYNRTINMYSLYDCYVTIDGVRTLVESSIGEDTTILISKNKLAQQIKIETNKDEVKNCFRVTGGDDIINAYVAACNMSGNNYIYLFSDFQLNDMPHGLSTSLLQYQNDMDAHRDDYYGENGVFTKLCKAYEDKTYYESGMSPDVSLKETTSHEQYNYVISKLQELEHGVGVYLLNNYNENHYTGIDNNVSSLAEVFIDSRYSAKVVTGTSSYNATTQTWTGLLQIKRDSDETDVYPLYTDISNENTVLLSLKVSQDDDINNILPYTEQKIYKALSQSSMADIDFDITNMTNDEIKEYFEKFALNRLKGFLSGYESCISVLCELNKTSDSSGVSNELYDKYILRRDIVQDIIKKRENQIGEIDTQISTLEEEKRNIQEQFNLKNYLDRIDKDYYPIFCSYIREDDYNNSNYTSDGAQDDNEIIARAQQLLNVANSELKKACVLQRSVSTDINNLLILPEFENFYEKFALFNYFRVKSDDGLFKLRLLSVSYSEDSVEKLNVSFSENVVSLGSSIEDTVDDIASVIQQASSISTSYPSIQKQAEQGQKAQNTFNELFTYGLNTANMMLRNSNNNEVTINQSGILCKRMDDEGNYSQKSLRVIGNGIYLTDNDWQTTRMAIGEVEIIDPITSQKSRQYGVIADCIVGKLIAGERMYIGNENGSVQITGDGITLDGGSITWTQKLSASSIEGIEDLADFQAKVTTALTGSSTTEIGEDYVISPKIAAQYLYVTNDNYSVEIDPNHFAEDNTLSGYLFAIRNKNLTDDQIIMGVDINGKGYFKGEINATNAIFSGSVTVQNGVDGLCVQYGADKSIKYSWIRPRGIIFEDSDPNFIKTIQSKTNSLRIGYGIDQSFQDTSEIPLEYIYFQDGAVGISSTAFCAINCSNLSLRGKDKILVESANIGINNNITIDSEGNIKTIGDLIIWNRLRSQNTDYMQSFNISCYWADRDSHAILTRGTDGLTAYLGYSGSDTCSTVTTLRGQTIKYQNSSGTSTLSDERLKNSFESLDAYDDVFMDIKPVSFKYNNGTSNRKHFGFGAGQIKESLISHGFTTQDFAGFVQLKDNPNEEGYCGIEDPMALIYTEFTAWNTHMIQKAINKINEQDVQIKELIQRIGILENR